MKIFYITFGQSHPLRDGWVEVEAESQEIALEKAFDVLGKKWAFLYNEDELESIKKYNPLGKLGRTIK